MWRAHAQPQPDLLLDLGDREKDRAQRDDQQSIGERDGLGSQKNLQRRQVADRKLGRCDDDGRLPAARSPGATCVPGSCGQRRPLRPLRGQTEPRPAKAASAGTGATAFSTGTDSPVRIASCAASPRASMMRRSAGTLSPASSSTTSPGTRSTPPTLTRCPSRSTVARGASISRIPTHRGLCLSLLDEPDCRIGQDHAGVDPMLQRGSHGSCGKQQVDEHVVDVRQEPQERPARPRLGQPFGPMRHQPSRRLGRGQAPGFRGDKPHRVFKREAVRHGILTACHAPNCST